MGSCQGMCDLAGEYVWIGGARYAYIQKIREILKNKEWEAGVDCLERAIGSSLWEWVVGCICFFWWCPREFWSSISER